MHLGQGFLHVLDVLRRIGEQHRSLSQVIPQHIDLLGRAERARQQTEGVRPLQPLAVMHVTFGTPLIFGPCSGSTSSTSKPRAPAAQRVGSYRPHSIRGRPG
jgi:hypothetical protein